MSWLLVSYWLPCGAFNFCRPRKIGSHDFADEDQKNACGGLPLDIRTYVEKVIAGNGFGKPCEIFAASFSQDSTRDPNAIYAINDEKRLLLIVDSHGFVTLGKEGPEGLEQSASPEAEEALRLEMALLAKDILSTESIPYFQANLLFQGLFNRQLKPEVFLARSSRNVQSTTLEVVDDIKARFAELLPDIISIKEVELSLPKSDQESLHKFHREVAELTRIGALRAFIRLSARNCLQETKWALEDVRRRLLEHTLGRVDMKERNFSTSISRHASINDATEAQLRAYMMYVGAKFPLFSSVHSYLSLTIDVVGEDLAQLPAKGSAERKSILTERLKGLKELWASWETTLDGCGKSLNSLEKAVDQSQRDRHLYEQEQTRAEQEAVAELERFREANTRKSYDSANLVAMILANSLTAFGILYAVNEHSSTPIVAESGSGKGVTANKQRISQPVPSGQVSVTAKSSPFNLPIPYLGATALIASLIFYRILMSFFKLIERHRKHNSDTITVFYELNLRIDREMSRKSGAELLARTWEPILSDSAEESTKVGKRDKKMTSILRSKSQQRIVATEFDDNPVIRASQFKVKDCGYIKSAWLRLSGRAWIWCIRNCKWSGYRIERANKDEALHKVHADLKFNIARGLDSKRYELPKKGELSIVYEVLRHVPSRHDEIVLRELRGTLRSPRIMTSNELNQITKALVNFFVNPLLLDNSLHLDIEGDVAMIPTLKESSSQSDKSTGMETHGIPGIQDVSPKNEGEEPPETGTINLA